MIDNRRSPKVYDYKIMLISNKDSYTYRKYKTNKKIFLLIILSFIFLFFVIGYIILKISSILFNPKIFTIIFLVLLSLFIFFDKLLDKKSNNLIEKNKKTWGQGAAAESALIKNLNVLGNKYKIINNIQNEKGDVDLVCVGPTGVFVVEVKSQSGFISWNNEILRNGYPFKKDFIKQAQGEKYYIKNILKEKLGISCDVQGILEFPNAKIDRQTINSPKENIWIGGRGFAKWVILNKGKEYLSNEDIEKIANYLDKLKEENYKSN